MDFSDPVVVAFIGLAVATVTGIASVLAIALSTRSARLIRQGELEAAQRETLRKEAREDAREQRLLDAAHAARIEASKAGAAIENVLLKVDGLLAEKTISDKREGAREQKIVSDEKAATLAEGQQQGRDEERARAEPTLTQSTTPVPVIDREVAEAIKDNARALVQSAEATEHVAKATEKK